MPLSRGDGTPSEEDNHAEQIEQRRVRKALSAKEWERKKMDTHLCGEENPWLRRKYRQELATLMKRHGRAIREDFIKVGISASPQWPLT
jgi:hypothetical protein